VLVPWNPRPGPGFPVGLRGKAWLFKVKIALMILIFATPLIKLRFSLKSSPSDGCYGYSREQIDIEKV
jgi:hypothetical protein